MTLIYLGSILAGLGAGEALYADAVGRRLGDLWHVGRVLYATLFTYIFAVGCIAVAAGA